MSPTTDSEDDETLDAEDDNEFENEQDIEDELLDNVSRDPSEDVDDQETGSDSSDDEDTDGSEDEPSADITGDNTMAPLEPVSSEPIPIQMASTSSTHSQLQPSIDVKMKSPSPVPHPPTQRVQTISAAQARRNAIHFPYAGANFPRTFIIEAICAIPHPVPTHSLAASHCMSHLLTGSDDGYIRDYDIFTALNGKGFLTAPQRHHSGVVEGLMKAGQLRSWWENPGPLRQPHAYGEEEPNLDAVYSMVCHSDALWALAGGQEGDINLFTVRHDPGRLFHVISAHKGPVSSMSMNHDEKGFISAGWDGEALQWDLNTGQSVRKFTSHGAQLATVAVRPEGLAVKTETKPRISNDAAAHGSTEMGIPGDSDAKSDASFDPLFDDEPEDVKPLLVQTGPSLAMPNGSQQKQQSFGRSFAPPKNAPPLLDSAAYSSFSSDIVMTASVDGQVILWDRRVNTPGQGVGRLWMSEKTPPWCLSACWSADGGQIYAGRRNGTVDVWDVRLLGRAGPTETPRYLKTLRNPLSSGVVSCVVALPDNKHIACASIDNIRLWNVAETAEPDPWGKVKSGMQFKIIPGHHGGYISQMNPAGRFLVSSSSNRGWHGDSTRTVFVHDIKYIY